MSKILFPGKTIPKRTASEYTNFIESFTDKCNVIIRTLKTGSCFDDIYPMKTDCCCWWDRNQFDTRPIGIPVRREGNVYWADGIFCSFDCCYAYLNEELGKIRVEYCYKDSLTLLNYMFDSLFPGKKIRIANDWRVLEKVGSGKMNIVPFRSGSIILENTANLKFAVVNKYFQVLNVT